MTEKEILKQLESMGTAQNRKVYARHRVDGTMYGVSYGNLERLRKTIKTDHDLAEKLWASGNHDARVLATMIADPAAMTAGQVDSWARDLDNYVLTDAFSGLVARSAHARRRFEQWAGSTDEWKGTAARRRQLHPEGGGSRGEEEREECHQEVDCPMHAVRRGR